VQQAHQHRPAAIGAGGVFFENRGAAGGAQLVQLRIGALFLGGDPRIANQPADDGGVSGFSRVTSMWPPRWTPLCNSIRCLETVVCRGGRVLPGAVAGRQGSGIAHFFALVVLRSRPFFVATRDDFIAISGTELHPSCPKVPNSAHLGHAPIPLPRPCGQA
jgi:hypothetical protein